MARDISALRQSNYSPVVQPPGHTPHMSNSSLSLAAPEGFSSAFGLLSLDDANVLAGLSNDGVPFFSGSGMDIFHSDPDATPMPSKSTPSTQRSNPAEGHNQLSLTPGSSRETETRELREFWRDYMRTPLTGPGSEVLQAGTHPTETHTPTSTGSRRVRVSSLPSVKTPTTDGDQPSYPLRDNTETKGTSSMRTTLHGSGGDDLRSYQAAVLARRTPMSLSLIPRKSRGESSISPQIPTRPLDRHNLSSPVNSRGNSRVDLSGSGSGSSTSSLAIALGKSESLMLRGPFTADLLDGEEKPLSHGSRKGSASEIDNLRPSFKRLPSQTLGPATSKRTQLSSYHSAVKDDEEGGDGSTSLKSSSSSSLKSLGMYSGVGVHHPGRAIIGRRRRMSAPTIAPMGLVDDNSRGMVQS